MIFFNFVSSTCSVTSIDGFLAVLNRYGLRKEHILEAEMALEDLAAQAQDRETTGLLPLVDIMGLLLTQDPSHHVMHNILNQTSQKSARHGHCS